jgi:hypothetical protein
MIVFWLLAAFLFTLSGLSALFEAWIYALVFLIGGIAFVVPAARWGRRESYPYRRSDFYSREARLRRAQLTTSVAKLKPREPFWRLLRILAWTLFGTHFAWALYMLVAAYLWKSDRAILERVILYYFAAIVELVLILVVVGLHSWVKRHEPDTNKVQIGDSPLFVSDFTPGTKLATVDLLAGPKDEGGERKPVHVELIPWGQVKGVSPLIAPVRGVIIARRLNWIDALYEKGRKLEQERLEQELAAIGLPKEHIGKAIALVFDTLLPENNGGQPPKFAGRLMGRLYKGPLRPLVYIKGDMPNWREYNWGKLVDEHFPGQTNDWTPIILALDPYDAYTWEAPGDQPALERELYESRARNVQVTGQLQDYTQEDQITKSWGGGRRDGG